jgi:hypothetical protein
MDTNSKMNIYCSSDARENDRKSIISLIKDTLLHRRWLHKQEKPQPSPVAALIHREWITRSRDRFQRATKKQV